MTVWLKLTGVVAFICILVQFIIFGAAVLVGVRLYEYPAVWWLTLELAISIQCGVLGWVLSLPDKRFYR